MSNIKVEVTMPDSFYRLIEASYDQSRWNEPSRPEMVAAFQEMINLLGLLLSSRFHPDLDDLMYFKDMDANVATFGYDRPRTPDVQAIGKVFLDLLRTMAQTPAYQDLIDEEIRRNDDPSQPGRAAQSPGAHDDDDRR